MKKFLLDTHIIVWFLSGNKRLNGNVEIMISNDEKFIHYKDRGFNLLEN